MVAKNIAYFTAKPGTPAAMNMSLHWVMTCSAGSGNGCQGRIEIGGPGDVRIVAPKRIACTGSCNADGPTTAGGSVRLKATSRATLQTDAENSKTVTFRLNFFCFKNGAKVPVGGQSISVAFDNGLPDTKHSKLGHK